MTIHNQFSFAIYSVLFFGFFIYTFAVLKGFPNFLGGMFSFSIILFFPFVFLKYLFNLKKESNAIEWIYLLLLCYVFFYSIFATLFLNVSLYDPPVIKGILFICYSLVGWYLGRFLKLEHKIYRDINFLFVIFIVSFFFVTIAIEGNPFAVLFLLMDESGIAATYQGIGRSIFFIGVFTLLFSKKNNITLFIIFTLLIFLVGSRTHLVGFVLLMIIYIMLAYPRLALISFALLAVIFLIVLSIMNIYFPETYDSIVNSRIAELFNIASSASFSSRVGTFANGWEVIKNHPFFGSFGHYFYYGGGYPHNLLYAWSNWGLFPFVTTFVLLLVTTFQSLFHSLKRKEHKKIFLVSYVTSVSLLHVFIVAPIDDISLGILIGLFVGIINEKRKSYPYL